MAGLDRADRVSRCGPEELKRVLEIKTGCRLHFGLVELCAAAEYCYAGLGLALQSPGYTIRVDLSGEASDSSPADEYDQRVKDARQVSSLRHPVEIVEVLPLHCGLGAGTQLGVAIAAASLLASSEQADRERTTSWQQMPIDEARWSEDSLARLSGRGKRSAIGLHAFRHGGFIVDQGHGDSDARHFSCDHYSLPRDWRIILATPQKQTGTSGQQETALMEQVAGRANPHAPAMLKLIDSISSIASNPASCFDQFTGQLAEYMRLASSLFLEAQGGMYNGEALSAVACTLKSAGASAVGQSSWGPTIFGFAADAASAEEIAARFQAISPVADCLIQVAKPAQHGATWRVM